MPGAGFAVALSYVKFGSIWSLSTSSLPCALQVTTYDGPVERLGRAEQFFFAVTETPRAEAKLRAMLFMVQVRRFRSRLWRDHVYTQNMFMYSTPVPTKSQKHRAKYEHGLLVGLICINTWFGCQFCKVCCLWSFGRCFDACLFVIVAAKIYCCFCRLFLRAKN